MNFHTVFSLCDGSYMCNTIHGYNLLQIRITTLRFTEKEKTILNAMSENLRKRTRIFNQKSFLLFLSLPNTSFVHSFLYYLAVSNVYLFFERIECSFGRYEIATTEWHHIFNAILNYQIDDASIFHNFHEVHPGNEIVWG